MCCCCRNLKASSLSPAHGADICVSHCTVTYTPHEQDFRLASFVMDHVN